MSDQRDRVYGLLGISRDVNVGDVDVDYTLHLPDVYARALAFYVKRHKNLDFLCFVFDRYEKSSEDPKSLAFPSWIPNWEDTGSGTWASQCQAAGRSSTLENAFDAEKLRLKVRGFRIDRVIWAYNIGRGSRGSTLRDVMERLRFLFPRHSGSTLLENDQFILTLCGTWVLLHKPSTSVPEAKRSDVRTAIQLMMTHFKVHPFDLQEYIDGLQEAEKICLQELEFCLCDKSIMFTEGGNSGLMYSDLVQESDEVWILFGCRMPMILRPNSNGS